MKKILVLAPHTDDGELGCGGTIAKFVEKGYNIKYVAFSAPLDELRVEVRKASDILGMALEIYDYEVRRFDKDQQDIRDTMIRLRDNFEPDLVLLPTRDDMHQDHGVIYENGLRIFRTTSILSYELPWNSTGFRNRAYVRLSVDHLEKKLKALKCYKTQKDRPYMDPENVLSLARVRGLQAGMEYAECFDVVRWII